jgi:uncharacterized protein YkwD
MHRPLLATAVATLALTGAAGTALPAASADAAPPGRSAAERELLVAVNAVRIAHGLPRLRPSWTLARAARAHSRLLAGTHALSHDGTGGEPFWKRLVRAGFPRNRWLGENLALVPACDGTAAEVVRMWMDSPGHRANLLSPRFRVVGLGVASSRDCGATVFTADFGG